jgi:beta-glucuronidase
MEAWLVLLTLCSILHATISGVLYPRESESREVVSLDGIWKFRTSPAEDQEKGFRNKWFLTNFEEVSNEDRLANSKHEKLQLLGN